MKIRRAKLYECVLNLLPKFNNHFANPKWWMPRNFKQLCREYIRYSSVSIKGVRTFPTATRRMPFISEKRKTEDTQHNSTTPANRFKNSYNLITTFFLSILNTYRSRKVEKFANRQPFCGCIAKIHHFVVQASANPRAQPLHTLYTKKRRRTGIQNWQIIYGANKMH